VKVHSLKRAMGAVIASSIVVAGVGAGLAGSAEARPAHHEQSGLIDLPLLELIPLELPVLSGLGDIGSLLTVTEPIWNLPGVTTDIVWLRDGVPIPGTEGLWSYLPTSEDGGHEIAAQITGTLLGVLPVTLITNALGISLPGEEATTPTATTAPKITGEAKVGKTLTGSAPVWDKAVDSTTYQWLRAGTAIAGATTLSYVVAPEDVGKAITLKATGTKAGATPGTASSAAVTGLLGDAPTATAPAVTGTPKVGETLSVGAPVWSVTGVTTAYEWQRNGTTVATGQTYVVGATDVGTALTAKATGTKTGYSPGSVTTAPVTGLLGDAPTPTSPPTMSSAPRIGQEVTANPGAWGTPEPSFAYQWRRDGVAIPGATNATYAVSLADATHQLSFTVTATRPGYAPGSAGSAGAAVPKLSSKTAVALIAKTVKKGKKATLKIVLTAVGAKPNGAVKVYDGTRLLKGYTVRKADNGVRIVKLPVLKPGKHKIKGVYAGTSAINGSTSRVVTLTVKKK
jgi:hypothetical protein